MGTNEVKECAVRKKNILYWANKSSQGRTKISWTGTTSPTNQSRKDPFNMSLNMPQFQESCWGHPSLVSLVSSSKICRRLIDNASLKNQGLRRPYVILLFPWEYWWSTEHTVFVVPPTLQTWIWSLQQYFNSKCIYHFCTNMRTEMEVTEILTKVSRLCQLSSHSRRLLSRLWISLVHKTPSYA
jgi:hypothetical protein